ncbi:MTH1187 family thiamine-binding protein [Kineococcus sp. GCM10028916]|uniref:thiamine-binding protein n=1 Tax=unclassified Kineococcus TaxID=2621656 RepID=UPI00363392E6
MIVAFSVAPSGGPAPLGGEPDSVSAAVADAVLVVRNSGLPHRTDSMFTSIEGDWDECMDVVRRACEAVGKHGPRVSLVLKADIRPGHTGEMTGKLDRLEAAVERAEGEAGRGQ